MSDLFRFAGPPSRWIARHGRPAECLIDWAPVHHGGMGWPSYEQDDGKVVFDLLLCFQPGPGHGPPRLLSRWYGAACMLAPDGQVPVHTGATGRLALIGEYQGEPAIYELDVPRETTHRWRPMVYQRGLEGWCALGSQGELAWRDGLKKATLLRWLEDNAHRPERLEQIAERFGTVEDIESMLTANDRAEALLRECLSPQQRIELTAAERFRVRGGETGRIYGVELGNGFTGLTADTCEPTASYCLHPEYWMPDADVALATKLALEDRELELETVAGAKETRRRILGQPDRAARRACEMEKELIR